jgi:hypothetical protein
VESYTPKSSFFRYPVEAMAYDMGIKWLAFGIAEHKIIQVQQTA